MKTIGLFEAKTKLSELCEEVASTGQACTITRRGQPLVRLEPAAKPRESIWVRRARHIKKYGALLPEEPDLELPAPLPGSWRDPLA